MSALFVQPAILLCFFYFVFQTTAPIGLQTFLPSALNCGTRRAAGRRDVGGYRLPARRHCRHRRRRIPRRADIARHDRVAATGLLLGAALLALIAAGAVPLPWIVPVFVVIGLCIGATGPSRDLIVRNATPKGAAGRVYGFVYSGLDIGRHARPDLVRHDARPRARARSVLRRSACLFVVAIGTVVQVRRAACRRPRKSRPEESTMELGLAGRRALVCAASKGLGRGCAEALAREGVDVTICARTEGRRRARRRRDRRTSPGRPVAWVACDITTPEGRAAALAACPRARHPGQQRRRAAAGRFPRLGPRGVDPRARREHADADRADQGDVDGMIERKFGRIVNITSSAVKAPIDILGLSNGARSGLTGFVAGLARKVVRHNVTINNLLPGPFDTDRLRTTLDAAARRRPASRYDEIRDAAMNATPVGPLRRPARIRRGLRVPVQRARRLHRRAEHPGRRRRVSGHVLSAWNKRSLASVPPIPS